MRSEENPGSTVRLVEDIGVRITRVYVHSFGTCSFLGSTVRRGSGFDISR